MWAAYSQEGAQPRCHLQFYRRDRDGPKIVHVDVDEKLAYLHLYNLDFVKFIVCQINPARAFPQLNVCCHLRVSRQDLVPDAYL